MDKTSKICLNCGKPFVPKRKNSRYCCVKCCRKAYQMSHPDVFLANSKKWRERHPERVRKPINLLKLTCPLCGNTFTQTSPRQKYCSTRCVMRASVNRRREKINERWRAYYRRKHPVKTEKRLCAFCGQAFVPVRDDSTCCSRSCSIKLSRRNHSEYIRSWNASYRKTPGARILREMRNTAYNEILETNPEAYAEYRRKRREKSMKRNDRTRIHPYKERLYLRFPDFICKGQNMLEFYSPKFFETSREGNAFARELAIERGKQTGRFPK